MTYRVVQWTTGLIASAAVRGIIEHPELELVGCFAWSKEKVGKDVGTLCGLDPIGLSATDDVEALIALKPDCVVYIPYSPDFDHVVRILESGINIATPMYQLCGWGNGAAARQRILDACERGGASLLSSGVYPGHANHMALALSAACARVDSISIQESLQLSEYENEKMFRSMGFDGEPGDQAVIDRCESAQASFKDMVRVMAHELGLTLDEVRFDVAFSIADHDLDFGYMVIRKGRVAGIKGAVSGVVRGEKRIMCNFVWAMGEAMTPRLPVQHGYFVEIAGDPPMRCNFGRNDAHEPGKVGGGSLMTAMPVVNAIPQLCAAPPGIMNFQALPFIKGTMR